MHGEVDLSVHLQASLKQQQGCLMFVHTEYTCQPAMTQRFLPNDDPCFSNCEHGEPKICLFLHMKQNGGTETDPSPNTPGGARLTC